MLFRAHFFVFLVVLMVVAEQVEGGVDEEFRELGFGGVPVLLRLCKGFGFGQDDLARNLLVREIREILEIVEREHIGGLVDSSVGAIECPNLLVREEGDIDRPVLRDLDLLRDGAENDLDKLGAGSEGVGGSEEERGEQRRG